MDGNYCASEREPDLYARIGDLGLKIAELRGRLDENSERDREQERET